MIESFPKHHSMKGSIFLYSQLVPHRSRTPKVTQKLKLLVFIDYPVYKAIETFGQISKKLIKDFLFLWKMYSLPKRSWKWNWLSDWGNFERRKRVKFCLVKCIHGISLNHVRKHHINFVTIHKCFREADFVEQLQANSSRCNFVALLSTFVFASLPFVGKY